MTFGPRHQLLSFLFWSILSFSRGPLLSHQCSSSIPLTPLRLPPLQLLLPLLALFIPGLPALAHLTTASLTIASISTSLHTSMHFRRRRPQGPVCNCNAEADQYITTALIRKTLFRNAEHCVDLILPVQWPMIKPQLSFASSVDLLCELYDFSPVQAPKNCKYEWKYGSSCVGLSYYIVAVSSALAARR